MTLTYQAHLEGETKNYWKYAYGDRFTFYVDKDQLDKPPKVAKLTLEGEV